MKNLYICNRYYECDLEECKHKIPHEAFCFNHENSHEHCDCIYEDTCLSEDECHPRSDSFIIIVVKCIPYFEPIEFITEEEMKIL